MAARLQTVSDQAPSVMEAPETSKTARHHRGPRDTQQRLVETLRTTRALQTTLEVEKLVEIFCEEIRERVPHDAAIYRNATQNVLFKLGEEARHSCTYRLAMGAHSLGELGFMRSTRFSAAETARLEELLALLLHPLRNALSYRYALWSASKDPLTGVNNRGALDAALKREIGLAHRHGTPLSLLLMDIDHFKSVNDRYGHTLGDCALRHIAECAASCIRGSDMLFRYGGEEFVILVSNTEWFGALMLAERIRTAVEAMECTCNDVRLNMTVSLGVSTLEPGDEPTTLFGRADEALYDAKVEGRNRVQFTDRAAR
ncbi:MAG: hypothetical protein B7Z66_08445 [Chromatiales bacterium 21-64-14]|nr:MAG: hypothetical protein B7Z66_08445 [Chromatiales bacterium 21-64-14]HQU15365.1 GGDEF domain-containing protein [Gammaproteobacteria bacterium]